MCPAPTQIRAWVAGLNLHVNSRANLIMQHMCVPGVLPMSGCQACCPALLLWACPRRFCFGDMSGLVPCVLLTCTHRPDPGEVSGVLSCSHVLDSVRVMGRAAHCCCTTQTLGPFVPMSPAPTQIHTCVAGLNLHANSRANLTM